MCTQILALKAKWLNRHYHSGRNKRIQLGWGPVYHSFLANVNKNLVFYQITKSKFFDQNN